MTYYKLEKIVTFENKAYNINVNEIFIVTDSKVYQAGPNFIFMSVNDIIITLEILFPVLSILLKYIY